MGMTLKEWMVKNGLNDVTFVAKYPVISRAQLSRIRSGKSRPGIKTARELSKITKIPAAKFVMGEAV